MNFDTLLKASHWFPVTLKGKAKVVTVAPRRSGTQPPAISRTSTPVRLPLLMSLAFPVFLEHTHHTLSSRFDKGCQI